MTVKRLLYRLPSETPKCEVLRAIQSLWVKHETLEVIHFSRHAYPIQILPCCRKLWFQYCVAKWENHLTKWVHLVVFAALDIHLLS